MIVIRTFVVAIVILGCLSFGPERKWFLLLGLSGLCDEDDRHGAEWG
jgi:hypothetical protein